MSDIRPTEKKFENHIEKHLNSIGFDSIDYSNYDRTQCLIKDKVIEFIKKTQPKEWDRLREIYDSNTEDKIISRISSEIASKGVIHVLRNPVVDRGVNLHLCYFEPKSDLNPDHLKQFQSNSFSVVRQLYYSTKNQNSIDMGLFLNGIPVVTMELKNQLTGQNVKHSENQYRYDRDPKEPLLNFKRVLVHFCVDNNEVSMATRLNGTKTRFFPYNKSIENPPVESDYRSSYLWKEILTQNSLLDIIENFAHVSKEKDVFYNEQSKKIETRSFEVQIFPRYHQLELIRNLKNQIRLDGEGNNYLVQHTTGSGKSYSIGWLAHLLTSLYRKGNDTKRIFDSVIVVTDRTVLDDQLRNTVSSLSKMDGVVFGAQEGSSQLKEYLESGKDIIITTIQKFPYISNEITSLSKKKFAVIIDEVHSSQSGELRRSLNETLTNEEEDTDYTLEDFLSDQIDSRGRQEHISFFGFTGTPKDRTIEIFGTKNSKGQLEPFHSYTMKQSIFENYTLDVLKNYTTYKRYFEIKQLSGNEIEIDTAEGTRQIFNYVDTHKETIENKVNIMLEHFIKKGSKEIQGKSRGMIIVKSRELCVRYFHEINKQLRERNINYRCLVGFSGEVKLKESEEKFTEKGLNLTLGHDGDVPIGLKDPKFRLLVVANKFQTGFDEPMMQSMYIDKILKDLQCVQTLSRLNRTMSGKTNTFILDFANDPESVRSSFQKFYKELSLQEETDPNKLYDIQSNIKLFKLFTPNQVEGFCTVFFDKNRDEGLLHPILDEVVDKWMTINSLEEREDFRLKIASFNRLYSYLAQIINFKDLELEKHYIFYRYLYKKLIKPEKERIDISSLIDLHSLRVQKLHTGIDPLENVDHVYEEISVNPQTYKEASRDFLSEIIALINSRYGITLSEENFTNLKSAHKKIMESNEVKKYMNGANSDQNKRDYMKKEFESVMLSFVNTHFDFYKKINEDESVKNLIVGEIYSD